MQLYEDIFNNCVPFQNCVTDGHSGDHIIDLRKRIIETHVNTRMFHEARNPEWQPVVKTVCGKNTPN